MSEQLDTIRRLAPVETVRARVASGRGTGVPNLPIADRGGEEALVVHLPWDDRPAPEGATLAHWRGGDCLVCALDDRTDLQTVHLAVDAATERLCLIETGPRQVIWTPVMTGPVLVAAVTT